MATNEELIEEGNRIDAELGEMLTRLCNPDLDDRDAQFLIGYTTGLHKRLRSIMDQLGIEKAP